MGISAGEIKSKCPYFICETHQGIKCEGITDGTTMQIVFKDRKARMAYQAIHCFNYPNKCPVSSANDRKYGS